jgi:hypothetical protein
MLGVSVNMVVVPNVLNKVIFTPESAFPSISTSSSLAFLTLNGQSLFFGLLQTSKILFSVQGIPQENNGHKDLRTYFRQ